MIWGPPLLAALALLLFVSGVPRRMKLGDRVEPYLAIAERGPVRTDQGMPWIRSRGRRSNDPIATQKIMWPLVAIALLMGTAAGARSVGLSIEAGALALLAPIAASLGYLGRDRLHTRSLKTQRAALIEELPSAIDLLTLAIVAGEAVPAAFERVTNSLGAGIGREFAATLADVRAGVPLTEALEGLARRVPDPSMERLVDAIDIGLARGTPMAAVLRAQAEDLREEKRRRLLELGGRREVLMLVPVVFFIMPVVVVFALYPGLVSLDLLVP